MPGSLALMYLLSIFFSLLLFCAPMYAAESSSASGEENLPPEFTLTTEAFLDNGALPTLYTCDSKNISPQLSWANPPAKTQSFALIFVDPTASTDKKYLWALYNIPATTTSLDEGITSLPEGTLQGKTSYIGPCPAKGSVHTYVFTLYALDQKLSLPAGADGEALIKAMANHVLGKSVLTAIYSRWPQ